MTVIDIYARVSLDADLKFRSTGDQVADCRDKIEDEGHEVGEVFIDNSKSAWNPKVRRPDWERLMNKIESGASKGVIVFDMARFSRKPIDGERLITAAQKGLIVLDSENGYDLTTANGRKTFRDHMNAAAYESDRLATRVRRGKRRKIERGESNHTHRPFGFEDDGMTIRPDEAEVIRYMVKWFLSGGSLLGLQNDLNERGILTSFGNTWKPASVRLMISRPRNVGLIVSHGKVVGRIKGDETIIAMEDHEEVVARLSTRRRGRPHADVYLGSGILVCGLCGHNLYGHPEGRNAKYSDGEPRRRYVCQPSTDRLSRGCNKITIDWRPTDALIDATIRNLLSKQELAVARQRVEDAYATRRRELRGQIGEAEANAEAMAERLGNGEVAFTAYDAFMARQAPRVARLRAELDALPDEADEANEDTLQELDNAETLALWDDPDTTPETRRRLARRALNGKVLLVNPADPKGPRRFDPNRVTLGDRPVRS